MILKYALDIVEMGNNIVRNTVFSAIPKHIDYRFKHILSRIQYLPTGRGYSIPIIKHTNSSVSDLVIIYSHGNSEDIEMIDTLCEHLSISLRATVYTYDYCGYGVHANIDNTKPTEKNIYADALTVFDFVCSKHAMQSVVLYGRSLGTAPAVYTAAHRHQFGGLILEAPFLTCAKTVVQRKSARALLSPLGVFGKNALFANEKYISSVTVPLLFIHGKKDSIVPFKHSQELKIMSTNAISITTIFVDDADHNDLYYVCGIRLTRNIQRFLSHIDLFTWNSTRTPYLAHRTPYLIGLQHNTTV